MKEMKINWWPLTFCALLIIAAIPLELPDIIASPCRLAIIIGLAYTGYKSLKEMFKQ